MEKEIVWTSLAQKDFWEIVAYLKESWPEKVLEQFNKSLQLKSKLLQKQPQLGFKSSSIHGSEKHLLPNIICLFILSPKSIL